MNENLKTRREHLKVLPLQKRLQAMENIRKESFPCFEKWLIEKHSECNLLAGCFIFIYTRQGHEYWSNINEIYFQDGK